MSRISDTRISFGVLEKVRETLKPGLPEVIAAESTAKNPGKPNKPDESQRLANMFAGLDVYEPAAVDDSSPIPLQKPTTTKAGSAVVYEAE